MDETQIIGLVDTKYNAVNTYLMYIILAVFGYIVIRNYSDIYFKTDPNKNKFTMDITYFMSSAQNNQKFLQDYITKIAKSVFAKQAAPTNNRCDNRDDVVQVLDKAVDNLNEQLKVKNATDIVNYQQAYLSMNNAVTKLSNLLGKVNDMQRANIEAVDSIYDKYSDAMRDYLNKLKKVLSIINYQVNVTYIQPAMQKMIAPLKKLYNSIYSTLIDNSDFLKKFMPEYDPASIPQLNIKIDSPQNLQTKFKASAQLLKTNGY